MKSELDYIQGGTANDIRGAPKVITHDPRRAPGRFVMSATY